MRLFFCSKMDSSLESSFSFAQDQFSCSICQDLLKDPVAIPCGHSYCMSCISGCWDQDEYKGVYSCPQCGQTFNPRPALGKNFILTEMVENLRKRKRQAARPSQCYPESIDVECDVCTEDKSKAIKSCLVCLESYCQNHFERHEEFHSRKRHKVTDATGRLQEMICPLHDKLLEMYCRTDQRCICMLCVLNEHKTHETVSTAEERADKQKHLKETLQQRIQEREKEREKLREAVESHKHSAQAAMQDSERILTELIRSLRTSRFDLMQLIKDQEKAAVSQTEGLSERLKQEIDDLRRRDAELEQLSLLYDDTQFLQSFQSLSVPYGSTDSLNFGSRFSFDDIITFVSLLKEKLQQTLKEDKEHIFQIVRYISVLPTPEYDSRNKFIQHYQQLTLDSNTAYKYLRLSEEDRVVTRMKHVQTYSDHKERFDCFGQVFCRERVSGRCYWEVEWSGSVDMSVSYKSKMKLGRQCRFGRNDQSWSLYCSDSKCLFRHDNEHTTLPVVSSLFKIGVYVDHGAGTLSFYSVSDTMSLIHRVHTTFTQPLYPGFGVYHESQVKLCDRA